MPARGMPGPQPPRPTVPPATPTPSPAPGDPAGRLARGPGSPRRGARVNAGVSFAAGSRRLLGLLGLAGIAFVRMAAAADEAPGGLPGNGSLHLEGGWASDYVFRGINLGSGLGAGGVEWTQPLGQGTLLDLGGKYLVAGGYEEAQAAVALTRLFGAFRAALGYRFHGLDGGDRNEVGLVLGTVLGGFDLGLACCYDTRFDGHFAELAGQREWQLSGPVAVRATAGLSASSHYYHSSSGFHHAHLRLDLPASLGDSVAVTPWVGVSLAMDAIDDAAADTLSAGVNLEVSF